MLHLLQQHPLGEVGVMLVKGGEDLCSNGLHHLPAPAEVILMVEGGSPLQHRFDLGEDLQEGAILIDIIKGPGVDVGHSKVLKSVS